MQRRAVLRREAIAPQLLDGHDVEAWMREVETTQLHARPDQTAARERSQGVLGCSPVGRLGCMVRSAWMVGMWALGVGGGCLICIARGSRVLTPSGTRAIETLAVGDAVYSVDVR